MKTDFSRRENPLLRRFDPRTLLLAAVGAAFCFSVIHTRAAAWACLAFSFLLVALRRPAPGPLLKRLAVINMFIAFIWLTVPLTVSGERVAALGPFSWSREGVRLAALVTLKCNAVALAFLALAAGMDLPLVGSAFGRLRVPSKLVFLFLFTCRYIHVVSDEWRRLQIAAQLRGFVPGNSLHTYRTYGNMLGLTFVNSIDRSRRVYEAMVLRGFDGTFRTVTELKHGAPDIVFLLVFFSALGGLLLLDFFLK